MSKEQEEAKELNKKVNKITKERFWAKPRRIAGQLKLFIVRLSGTLFALSLIGLGVYAITIGIDQTMVLKKVALIVSGVCAVVDGVFILYKVLVFGETE